MRKALLRTSHYRRNNTNRSTWHAIQAAARQRQNAAILAAISDRLVGELPEEVASTLELGTTERKVKVSASQQRHIIKRRQLVSKLDVELCIKKLKEALLNIQYLQLPQRDQRVYELIAYVPSVDRRVLIALKVVFGEDSKSGEDEIWIRTAHPFGKKLFKKKSARNELQRIN